jgi:hypothetical protein
MSSRQGAFAVEPEMHERNKTNLNNPWNQARKWKPWKKSRQHYGPSSDMVFLNRIASFLSSVSKQQVFATSLVPELEEATYVDASSCITNFSGFSKRHEEGFLDLFSQNYHPLIPVLHLESFMEHFASLWPWQFAYSTAGHLSRSQGGLLTIRTPSLQVFGTIVGVRLH